MADMPTLKIDNPFFNFMGRLGDLVILNLTWLVCCLPVVTAGASTTALHYVARKMAAGEPYRVWKSFFDAFRENWKPATRLWLCLLAAGCLFMADLWAGAVMPGATGNLFRGIGMTFLFVWLLVVGYCFPLLARYRQSTFRLILLSLSLAARKLPVTVCYVLLVLLMPGLLILLPELFALVLLPWVLAGGAFYAWIMAVLLLPVQQEMENLGGTNCGNLEAETRL